MNRRLARLLGRKPTRRCLHCAKPTKTRFCSESCDEQWHALFRRKAS